MRTGDATNMVVAILKKHVSHLQVNDKDILRFANEFQDRIPERFQEVSELGWNSIANL